MCLRPVPYLPPPSSPQKRRKEKRKNFSGKETALTKLSFYSADAILEGVGEGRGMEREQRKRLQEGKEVSPFFKSRRKKGWSLRKKMFTPYPPLFN